MRLRHAITVISMTGLMSCSLLINPEAVPPPDGGGYSGSDDGGSDGDGGGSGSDSGSNDGGSPGDAGGRDAGQDAGPARLAISPLTHAFGMVLQSAMGTPRSFAVSNPGGAATSALSVTLSGPNADQFTLGADLCSGLTLSPQESCDVTLSFTPNAGGSKNASLGVTATSGGTAVATVNGTGLAPAAISVAPLAAYFGAQVGGQPGMTQQVTVTNNGDVATGAAIVASLVGADPGAFTVTGSTCTTALLAGAWCGLTVQFTPPVGSPGVKAASLDLRPLAGPGGSGAVSLTGTSLSPSGLGFNSVPFGSSLIGVAVDRTFTLTNSGGSMTGAISLSLGGGQAADYQLLSPSGTDCVSGTTALAGGGSCTARVRFTPAGRGARSSNLTATGAPGGLATAALVGAGQLQATLSSTTPAGALGAVENGVGSSAFLWTITNSGDLPSGLPTLTTSGANPAEFVATGCTAALDPAASCVASVTLTPTAAGGRSATITATATPGGMVSLAASGPGQARLTVLKVGTGAVTSSPAGIACGPTCNALFNAGSVTLSAATANGSNSFFTGWSGGGCGGPRTTCDVTADVSKTVTATFAAMTHNLAFVSSNANVAHNLGALSNYDSVCNSLATAAGINNATNNGFLAWMSTSTARARSRFAPSVRGWVRLDGKPLFDLVTDPLAPSYRIFNALDRDERGLQVPPAEIATATPSDDGLPLPADACADWTVNDGSKGFGFGFNHAGPQAWTFTNYLGCDQPSRIYCFGNTKTVALNPPAAVGKKIWLTATPHVPSAALTPDAHCQAEKPLLVGTAKALISTTTVPASVALSSAQSYVRLDGQLVGGHAELVAAGNLQSGVWQGPTGSYLRSDAWTGYNGALTNPSTVGTNCLDWTSSSATMYAHGGAPWAVTGAWWAAVDNNGCSEPNLRLICVEQ